GESGLPTRASFTVPPGFHVSSTRYPGPERFESPGPVVSYGYERDTALLAEITPPAALPGGAPVQIRARVSWLACQESCIPGRADLAIALPVSRTPARPGGEILRAYQERLPRPIAQLTGAGVRWSGTAEAPVLEIAVPGADDLLFFPGAGPGLAPDAAGTPALAGQGAGAGERSLRLELRRA